MDFLDNAIIKAKETIEVVSKKTSEIVTTEKQKFDVSALKAKLQKDYAKLGRYFYVNLKEDTELSSDAKAIVEEISNKIAAIEALNSEIANTKNRRVCPACKSAIPDNSVFCNICGEKLVFESEE
jgi:rRNA maturation endonuclease Nob1